MSGSNAWSGASKPSNAARSSLSLARFLELARERYRRDLRAARFGMVLLLVQIVFVTGWVAWNTDPTLLPELGRLSRPVRVLPVPVPVGAYLWLRFWRTRATRELARLETTLLELAE